MPAGSEPGMACSCESLGFLRKAKVANSGLVEGLGFRVWLGSTRERKRLNQAGAADLSEGAASSEGEEATQRKSHHGVPGLGFRGC